MAEKKSTKKDIARAVNKRVDQEKASMAIKEEEELSLSFVSTCLNADRLGDGTLFAALHKGKYLYSHAQGRWFNWGGHHWDVDRMLTAQREVEAVVAQYARLIKKIDADIEELAKKEETEGIIGGLRKKRGVILSKIKGIRRPTGINDTLLMATIVQDNIAIRGDEIDKNPWLLGFNNGVMDLRTGNFRDGRIDDYILNAIPHDWEGFDAESPVFDKFLQEIFEGNEELIAYVLRFFGYGLVGAVIEHVFLVMHGEHGRNGKSTLVGILQHVLGSLMQPIQSEMLMEQSSPRNPGSASPHITALKGLRIAFASETTEKFTFSPGQLKWFTGGDPLTGRENYGKEAITFYPTHLLLLLTNELCKAPPNDKAFWYRMHVLEFGLSFVNNPKDKFERKADPMLMTKLKGEQSGILARLVSGCIDWKRGLDEDGAGLRPPKAVLKATKKYRESQDICGEFIEMKLEKDDLTNSTTLKCLYVEFTEWFNDNRGEKVFSRTWLSKELEKHGFIKCKKGGKLKFYGVKIALPF